MPIKGNPEVDFDKEIVDEDEIIEVIDVDFDDDDETDLVVDKIDGANESNSSTLTLEEQIDLIFEPAFKQVSLQIAKFEGRLDTVESTIDSHGSRLDSVEEELRKLAEILEQESGLPETETVANQPPTGVFNQTLGVVGDVLHSVVDTAAFILESAVDLATLGRAKRS